jgi:hypothetical protein
LAGRASWSYAALNRGGESRHNASVLVWLDRALTFIEPGRPDQDGKHERFHETLKAATASPPRATIAAQQAAFTRFQVLYND